MKTILLEQTNNLRSMYTEIRNKATPKEKFVFYANRIITLLLEQAISFLPVRKEKVVTPTNKKYEGITLDKNLCFVSIMRAGDSMEKTAMKLLPGARIGKILIQRNEKTAKPKLMYSKLPENISKGCVLLLDPMLATGGSACQAIQILKENKVKEEKIIFVNLISCPEGIQKLEKEHPRVLLVTRVIDEGLNKDKFIVPGLGDFGDRYFGT